eukprot:gnl/MRDRNA2_/MRDRNA2_113979_c0_seq1.p1 gnl/MRDRNA2_/MRDRNA2_113979_c0~~gnl/MRDRNA2_/MRDRNA2_113979_c0_seq1.p1  ORF type:complete len:654 (+),score=138.45 gnl/MRDRNA2_/MRDRNA2_113979_c0_seq1:106-1962(+)
MADLGDRPATAMSEWAGEESMMTFINQHMESILQPFAQNVDELHKTVINIADNLRSLGIKTDANISLLAEHGALIEGLRTDHDKTLAHTEETRKLLDSFIHETNVNQQATTAKFEKQGNTITLAQRAIEALQQRLDKTCHDVTECQDTEERLRTDVVRSQATIDRLMHALEALDKAHETTIETINRNKAEVDKHIHESEAMVREMKELSSKFDIINEHCESRFRRFDERTTESQRQLLQFRKEIHQAHDATAQLLCGRLDAHDVIHDETRARVNKLDLNLASHTARTVENGENFNKLLKAQEQKFMTEVNDVRVAVGEAATGVSKNKREIEELQGVVGHPTPKDGKNKIQLLEDEMDLNLKRNQRVEKILGLEPLTKENADGEAGMTLKGGILLTDKQIKQFEDTFQRYDADGSGNISTQEVGDVLKSLGHTVAIDIVQILVDEIDLDHSGEINFDEFCALMSKMLGPDGQVDVDSYMKRMSDAANREAKQNEIVEKFPAVTQEIEKHTGLIAQESQRLTTTSEKLEGLAGDHLTLVAEVEKLRKATELSQQYWKGLSRGIKNTKATALKEGEGELVPSAMRLRQMLPSLGDRPNTHSGAMTARPVTQSGARGGGRVL